MLNAFLSCLISIAVAAQDPTPAVKAKPAPPAPSAAPQAEKLGVLDELIAKTNELHTFEASFELTTSKPEDEALLLVYYEAPDHLRIDRITKAGGGSSMWCVGGVLTLQAHGPNAMHGAADYSPALGTMRGFQKVFQENYPEARALVGHAGAFVNVRWWFDDKANKANYLVECLWSQNRAAVLGWLDTLRSKQVTPTDDGEHYVFDTDSSFHVVISKQTGFMEQLDGQSPGGEMHLKLTALTVDKPADPSRFKVQEGVTDGREISEDLRRSLMGKLQGSMRDGMYSVIAGAAAGPAWDDATKAKVARVCRAFHESSINSTLESWREIARKKHADVAERLSKLAADGKTPEEVAQAREKELSFLNKALDELRTGFTTRLGIPTLTEPLPRGPELLAIESEVVGKTFDEIVRGPVVLEFTQATTPKSK